MWDRATATGVILDLPLVGRSKNAKHFFGWGRSLRNTGPPPEISSLRYEISTSPQGEGKMDSRTCRRLLYRPAAIARKRLTMARRSSQTDRRSPRPPSSRRSVCACARDRPVCARRTRERIPPPASIEPRRSRTASMRRRDGCLVRIFESVGTSARHACPIRLGSIREPCGAHGSTCRRDGPQDDQPNDASWG
jgi:hypothetical protein